MAKKHRVNQKFYFGRPVWRNSTKTLKTHPLKYYFPKDIKDMVKIVDEGIKQQVSVRAVGSGHSYSKAPKATGLLVDTSKLQGVIPYGNATKQGNYFEVEAGMKVKALNKTLDEAGFSISAMGGIDHQSIGGAISTGTHGSSLTYGAMSKMVKSIVLVTQDKTNSANVEIYRIEPSDGFSDPLKCKEQLIADDEVFLSVLVSFGCFGLIYSYVLEVEPMFYLTEKKSVRLWQDLKTDLLNGLLGKHDSVMVLVNPYAEGKKQIALVTTHDREAKGKKNLRIENLRRKYLFRFKRFCRSWQYELVSRFPLVFWISILGFNRKPQNIAKLLDTAIKSQKDEAYFNKGYKVMYQGLDYIKERAYDSEFAVPIKDNHYLNVLDQLIEFLKHVHKTYHVNITSPVGLRFVRKSKAYLTPEHDTDVCYIDTPVLMHIYGRETVLDKIQEFMLARDAIPHWGKINDRMDAQYVEKKFPRIVNFKKQLHIFNPNKIFSNEFTRQVLDY